MTNIMVATDGSSGACRAIDVAAELAKVADRAAYAVSNVKPKTEGVQPRLECCSQSGHESGYSASCRPEQRG
jgi:hypothetical protein